MEKVYLYLLPPYRSVELANTIKNICIILLERPSATKGVSIVTWSPPRYMVAYLLGISPHIVQILKPR